MYSNQSDDDDEGDDENSRVTRHTHTQVAPVGLQRRSSVWFGWNFALSAAMDTFRGGHDGEFEDFSRGLGFFALNLLLLNTFWVVFTVERGVFQH